MGKFVKEDDPTIEDSYHKQMGIDGQTCSTYFWDTAEISENTKLYLAESQGCILIYAINSAESFAEIPTLMWVTLCFFLF